MIANLNYVPNFVQPNHPPQFQKKILIILRAGLIHTLDEGVLLGIAHLALVMLGEVYPGGPVYQVGVAVALLYLLAYHDASRMVAPLRLQKKLDAGGGRERTPEEIAATAGAAAAASVKQEHRSFRNGFLPAEVYDGPRYGMVFKLGGSGVGYYTDVALGFRDNTVRNALVRRDEERAAAAGEEASEAAEAAASAEKGVAWEKDMEEVQLDMNDDDEDEEGGRGEEEDGPRSPLKSPGLRRRGGGGGGGILKTPSPGGKGVRPGFDSTQLSPGDAVAVAVAAARQHREGLAGGVLLHSPNGVAWWGLTAVILVAVCGDVDFLTSSVGHTRPAFKGHR